MRYQVVVTEQSPTPSGSVYCEVSLKYKRAHISFGTMYFIRDKDYNVIQFPLWLFGEQYVLQAIKRLGYKF